LVAQGYQVLMFDFRGQGLSGPSPLSGGVLEAGDYLSAVDYLKKENRLQKPVIFFGFSMGAMCALRAANDCPEAEAVIADSPLANLKSYVARRPPGEGFAFLPGFLGRCLAAYDKLAGLSLTPQDLDLVPVVEKLKGIPVLYVTGEKDNLARSEEVRKLFQKTPGRHKRLTYIQDAGHEETYSQFPKIYEQIVSQFLRDLREGFPKGKDEFFFPKTTPVKKP
jgi:alpha-beta hydrolase superfamily lysophospholipase